MTAEPGKFGVLIVDDEPNIRSGLGKGLSGEAERLSTAANADEALALFAESPFHFVIADVRLNSGISGIEMLKQILHVWPGVIVIVMTACGDEETIEEAMQAGASQVLAKPLDLESVRRQVRAARERHRSEGLERSSR